MSIEVKNLRKSFGDSVAVAGISLDIPEGEMLVLLGPSGCGKTTTMRCIAGLEVPDSGHISIGGTTVFDDAERINVAINRRRVGMVFQSYAIWPHMTVFENVSFPLEMEGVGSDETSSRVNDVLNLVGLDGFAERGASYLSGGQMQRVALARSLVMQPDVLLFDEPLSNLDARLRDHLRIHLREIQTQVGITSIYVTHDQREALALADQIMVMQFGEVLQTGEPVSLYQRPKTSAIAEFLGYSNIFDVTRLSGDGASCTVVLEGGERHLSVGVAAPDDTAQLAVCVRPDDVTIRLRQEGETLAEESAANVIAGDVILASFMGSHMQYRVRVGAQEVWEVLSPVISTDIKLGSPVSISVDPALIHLLPKK